jgi:hypothetical protein
MFPDRSSRWPQSDVRHSEASGANACAALWIKTATSRSQQQGEGVPGDWRQGWHEKVG